MLPRGNGRELLIQVTSFSQVDEKLYEVVILNTDVMYWLTSLTKPMVCTS